MKRVVVLLLCLAVILAGCENQTAALVSTPAPSTSPRVTVSPTPKPFDGSGLVWQLTPQSTCFYAIAYDKAHETLAVIFNSNTSRTYLYYDFTASDWNSFASADSLGSFYNKNIKGQYSGKRIDEIAGTYFEP